MASPLGLKENFSGDILSNIFKVSTNEQLQDYKVQVENTVYGCHKLMLCAVSEFFQCLIRSDMIESRTNFVQLKDISSSTFALILKLVYTGQDVVTKDNCIDLWYASDRLGIAFLSERCQEMAISCITVQNCGQIYQAAKQLESKPVLEKIYALILSKFKRIKENGAILLLEFEEFLKIISSDRLVVHSEDFVIFSVIDWVMNADLGAPNTNNANKLNYSPKGQSVPLDNFDDEMKEIIGEKEENDVMGSNSEDSCRKVSVHSSNSSEKKVKLLKTTHGRNVYLPKLLHACRFHLASPQCLSQVFLHPLIQQDPEARKIIFLAVLDKVRCVKRRHHETDKRTPCACNFDTIFFRVLMCFALITLAMLLALANE
ncbi:kelch repeat and BTB domain-containing protein 3 [Biomphalaria glabrata]|uniref:BTB domain-containing protein n=1 Tax=Biomphalaria glabrata TaxID=6526 RepID=A0A2C9L0Z1_BIOGL|nr:kelch repeat and BTB domain-containing protein 3 [Biomphalaria glabrata]